MSVETVKANQDISINRIVWAIKKHAYIAALSLLGGLLFAYLVLSVMPPKYKATAQFLFDPAAEQVANPDSTLVPAILNMRALERVVALVQSPSTLKQVAAAVVASAEEKNFKPRTAIQDTLLSPGLTEDVRKRRLIHLLEKDLTVKTEAADQIVTIEYQSKSPEEAAYIANTIVTTFISDRETSRKEVISQATKWLDDRFLEAKDRLIKADNAIQRYKADHRIESDTGTSANDSQLAQLREQLQTTQAKLSEAEGLYGALEANVSGANYTTLAELLDNTTMERLRSSLITAESELAAAKAKFGATHPEVQGKQANVSIIREQILAEARRKILNAKSELDALRQRRDSLKADVGTAEEKLRELRSAEVQLRELQRERDAIKSLYDSMLTKLTQTAPHQTSNFPEFKLLLDAAVPDRPKISPLLVWIAGGVAGFGMGFVIIFLIEYFDDRLIHVENFSNRFMVQILSLVPSLTKDELESRSGGRKTVANGLNFAKEFPNSLFTNALLGAYLKTTGAAKTGGGSLIAITSPAPGDGKTMLSSNLASLSSMLGRKTLLIDLDARKPWFHGVEGTGGYHSSTLDEYLQENPIGEVLTASHAAGGYDIVRPKVSGDAAWLGFVTPEIHSFFDYARSEYAQIWIDTPPVQMFADPLAWAGQVDGFLVVAQWAKTSKKQLSATLSLIAQNGGRPLGLMINRIKVDPLISGSMASYKKYYGQAAYTSPASGLGVRAV